MFTMETIFFGEPYVSRVPDIMLLPTYGYETFLDYIH